MDTEQMTEVTRSGRHSGRSPHAPRSDLDLELERLHDDQWAGRTGRVVARATQVVAVVAAIASIVHIAAGQTSLRGGLTLVASIYPFFAMGHNFHARDRVALGGQPDG